MQNAAVSQLLCNHCYPLFSTSSIQDDNASNLYLFISFVTVSNETRSNVLFHTFLFDKITVNVDTLSCFFAVGFARVFTLCACTSLFNLHSDLYPQHDFILGSESLSAALRGWSMTQSVTTAVVTLLYFSTSTMDIQREQWLVQAASPNGYWQIF